jgi:short-subunit dehydrogenase
MSPAGFRARYGPWALIAGASEGLGAAFAEGAAARGLNLLLVARRAEALDALAAELRGRFSVETRTAAIDLGDAALLEKLRAATAGLEIGLCVYNAARSYIGDFLQQPLADKLRIVDVNCRGPLILADECGRAMAARGRGGIILMSSLAASQGSPLVATYAATKAFNLVLAEGLWDELGRAGVDVLACRAGATRTPGYERAGPAAKISTMEPAPVVARALDSLGKSPSVVPGAMNRLASFFLNRVFTRRAAIRTLGRATRKLYPRT